MAGKSTPRPAAAFVELPESHDYVRGLLARGLLIELPNDAPPPRGKATNAANAATEQSNATGAK
ncbi:MAG: hypothetical protein ORN98_07825 [Alphaproteobacteria bacterium]|nr:hypothetical protein [Alphaproteobacteria bacterium]